MNWTLIVNNMMVFFFVMKLLEDMAEVDPLSRTENKKDKV